MKPQALFILFALIMLLAACGGDDDSQDNQSDNNQPASTPIPEAQVRPAEQKPPPIGDTPTATVSRVISGDTLELSEGRTVRLIGVNAPDDGQAHFEAARSFTENMVGGKTVKLEAGSEPRNALDQELFYVWLDDQLVNWELVRGGYANRAAKPPNIQYDVYIADAQSKAIEEHLGMWQPSEFTLEINLIIADPIGVDEENLNSEFIQIANQAGTEVPMAGFTLFDAEGNTYTFTDEFILGVNQMVRVKSGCGRDTSFELYWCSSVPIWDNNGDTAFLLDVNGHYVDHYLIKTQ